MYYPCTASSEAPFLWRHNTPLYDTFTISPPMPPVLYLSCAINFRRTAFVPNIYITRLFYLYIVSSFDAYEPISNSPPLYLDAYARHTYRELTDEHVCGVSEAHRPEGHDALMFMLSRSFTPVAIVFKRRLK